MVVNIYAQAILYNCTNNRAVFERSREAIMAKINENEAAVAALAVTKSPMLVASASNVPDFTRKRTGT